MIPKVQRYYILLLSLCLFSTVLCSSSVKEALEEHLKDIAHNDNSESIKLSKEKEEKNHHVDSEIKDSHSNQYSKSSDDSKFLTKDHESKITSDKDAYGGYNTKQDKLEDSHTDGFKTGHKKGHHKQGFQNSYHKDESSNKSTYFDDFNDEGDRSGYNSKANSYDNHSGRNYQGSRNNEKDNLRHNYNSGGHNKYGDVADKHLRYQDDENKYLSDNLNHYNKNGNDHGAYDRGKYHNRYEYKAPEPHHNPDWDWKERRNWDWNNRDWTNRRDWDQSKWQQDPRWENDYSRPGYYDDHGVRHGGGFSHDPEHGYGYRYGESRSDPVADLPRHSPVVARRKQTITIYEDPRYSNQENSKVRREEGDYIELDYQPSSRKYATYDDTYYSRSFSPPERKQAKPSEINKLVYNYRRQ